MEDEKPTEMEDLLENGRKRMNKTKNECNWLKWSKTNPADGAAKQLMAHSDPLWSFNLLANAVVSLTEGVNGFLKNLF